MLRCSVPCWIWPSENARVCFWWLKFIFFNMINLRNAFRKSTEIYARPVEKAHFSHFRAEIRLAVTLATQPFSNKIGSWRYLLSAKWSTRRWRQPFYLAFYKSWESGRCRESSNPLPLRHQSTRGLKLAIRCASINSGLMVQRMQRHYRRIEPLDMPDLNFSACRIARSRIISSAWSSVSIIGFR